MIRKQNKYKAYFIFQMKKQKLKPLLCTKKTQVQGKKINTNQDLSKNI